MFKPVILLIMALLSPMAFAEVPSWEIIPGESTLSFTATQNNAPVTGSFQKFTGVIKADPDQLDQSSVHIVVSIGSIATSYQDISDTLKTPEWFNVKLYPQAIFDAKQFTKTGDNQFTANGQLTIRDKTIPVTLTFTLASYTKDKAKVIGVGEIKRSSFGVGQGEWQSTEEIKDNVKIEFTINAKQA